ncbi:general transcription factor II-I repeat domain-containing protein 2-like [Oratosquilla oratoria]|uniref:general transcription factor II-I repeat domain-containing protein 2-like n=1 Tax=Oratosquilla oratoria TaxID=337810 RepID=UPI003F768C9D
MEYAKAFMLDVSNEIFDDFSDKDKIIKQIKDMPLSAKTGHDRTIMIANQVADESTDISHLSQFSVIARYAVGVGDTLREESLAVLPMKGSTRGEDFFKSFMEFAKEINLPMDKLISVCTDGSPCMVFCARTCGEQFGEVMSLVIKVVNFIFARALKDRQFRALLYETGNNYPGRLVHFERLRQFKDVCTANNPAQYCDLQSFKARFVEFRGRTRLIKFITHPHECAVDKADLSYIPDVSIKDFKVESKRIL